MPIDYNDYPANWKTEIRPAVLARANHRCEECNVKNHTIIKRFKHGAWRHINCVERDMILSKVRNAGYTKAGAIKALGFTKIVLTVAHLDHDAENHDVKMYRLKALCQRCHLKHDKPQHMQSRKYGRHHKRNQAKLEL